MKRCGRPILPPRRPGAPDAGLHPRHDPATTSADTRSRRRFLRQAQTGLREPRAQPRDLHFLIGDSLARLERYKEAEPYLEGNPSLPQTFALAPASRCSISAMNAAADAERALDRSRASCPLPAT